MAGDDHRLEFLDHTALKLHHATGRDQLMQSVWVYEHPVDLEALRQFHSRFSGSIGNRVIELSPVPFGRPRWVRPLGAPAFDVVDVARPRTELLDWADELGALHMDHEQGPAWRMVVQPFSDGSTGISLIGSHLIGDGSGALLAIFTALTDMRREVPYSLRGTRTRWQAWRSDIRQAVHDLPLAARTARSAARMAVAARGAASAPVRTPSADDAQRVLMPTAVAVLPTEVWESRAAELGGNTYALFAAVAAALGKRMGRVRADDGTVTLIMALNQRASLEDDRALAMTFMKASVDPDRAGADLTETRTQLRSARREATAAADSAFGLVPLVPWLPARAVKKLTELMFAYSDDRPVSASNLGELVPQLGCLDGSPAEHVIIRALDNDVTLGELRRSHGHLVVVSGSMNGELTIAVEAYELGADNSRDRLRRLVNDSLAEFGLTATLL